MARPEVTGCRPSAPDIEPADRDAYSVEAFARAHSLSVAMFYKLRAQGLAPTCFKVGTRTLISREAAARWRAAREQSAAAEERKTVKKPQKQPAQQEQRGATPGGAQSGLKRPRYLHRLLTLSSPRHISDRRIG